MLIKFHDIVNKYGKPKGIIHIGAHLLEERESYLQENISHIIWIEANTDIVNQILKNQTLLTNEQIYNYAITDISDQTIELFCTNNGQSSSILQLDKHLTYYPHIVVNKIIHITSKRMDSLILENNLNLDNYNFLNLDIQGAELLAIKSFGKFIQKIKYIYTEVNTAQLYKNCALLKDIDTYLYDLGFIRQEISMTSQEWGDALYVKK
jgi:FkbM family methyltransferase